VRTYSSKSRLHGVILFFVFIFTFFAFRLFYLQYIKSDFFKTKAKDQHSYLLVLEPQRGHIYDRNKRLLGCNLKVNSIYATPHHIKDKEKTASLLARILNLDKTWVFDRLSRKKGFVWVKRKVTEVESKKVEALNLRGIDFIEEHKRFYPNGNIASHILGFADIDNKGLEGIELSYDRYLKGEPGWKAAKRDAKGRELVYEATRSLPPSNGYNIVLTLDEIIQHTTERVLDEVTKRYKAKSAVALVMDPHSGRILALANRPSFDPNEFKSAPPNSRRNRAVTDYFEPGSIFKIVTASAALNEDIVDFDDVFFCENGKWKVAGHMLHDHKPHGNLNFKQVIEKSSNIGTVKVALRVGEEKLYKYISRFGFGKATDVDMPGEVSGLLRPQSKWSKFTISSIPMGQEIAVTAMQMACAISAIANGGVYYRPMIVDRVEDERSQVIKIFESKSVRRVIDKDTARGMREILKGAVENGTGKKAKLKGYTSAGKTGTAQKVDPSGKYSHSRFIASFIGFAPAENPKIAVCVFVDEPRPVYYGGTVAAPAFRKIAQSTLRYLDMQKDGILER